jgi:hypothetical protein
MGIQPFVRPLAAVRMSGVTPNSCEAKGAPVQDAVTVADLTDAFQVAARRNQHARGAGNRLDNHCGDCRRVVQGDEPL